MLQQSFGRLAIAGAALSAGLAFATAADATQIFLQSSSMNTSRTAWIDGPGMHENAYIAPIKFTAFEGVSATGPSFDLVAFCVDIFHDISLGTLNLKYDDNYDLTTNSKYLTTTAFQGGTLLTHSQIVHVGRLINYGEAIYALAPNTATKLDKLAAIQGAIWQVINPGYTVTSTAAVNGYIATYSGANYAQSLTGYGTVHSGMTLITETGKYGKVSAHQSFGFGAVPEPATWALMIGGFGLVGAALRRRRAAFA